MVTGQGEGIIGEGKWLLLKTIKEKGSLMAASKELNISYRKAWGDIRKTEQLLGIPLLDKTRGGKDGGASNLTKEGMLFVEVFENAKNKVANAVQVAGLELQQLLENAK